MTQRLYSYRQGDRSEYLAQTVLSALGLAVSVPRQEDIGIDFYCTLGRDEGNVVRFHESYAVQVKSSSDSVFEYGGVHANTGEWKAHEIVWLLGLQTPFFIARVDRPLAKLDLYCTTSRWFACHNGCLPCKLVFRADTPSSDTDMHNGTKTPLSVVVPDGVEAVSWELPLGQPVLSISCEQAEDRGFVNSVRNVLRQYIYIDLQNSAAASNGIQYFRWPLRIHTNRELTAQGLWVQWHNRPTYYTHVQLRTLALLVASLLRTYEGVNDGDKVSKLGALLEMLPRDPDLDLVRKVIQDGMHMQAAKVNHVESAEKIEATSEIAEGE